MRDDKRNLASHGLAKRGQHLRGGAPQHLLVHLGELADHFSAETRGELVLVIAGAPASAAPSDEVVASAVADELAAGTSVRDAATRVSSSLGVAHRRAYEIALATRRQSEG